MTSRGGSRGGSLFRRDEFEYEQVARQKSRQVPETLTEALESDHIYRPIMITITVLGLLVACTALGLAIWALVAGNDAKSAGSAAISNILAGGEALASQVAGLASQVTGMATQLSVVASSVSDISAQEATTPPPLTMDDVIGAICASGSGIVGHDNVTGFTQDDCDSIYIVSSVFKTPNKLWTAHVYEVCATVGDTLEGFDQFRMAVYADDGFGVPDQLLAVSDIGMVTANSLNCASLNLTLGESQSYWLAFMSNADDCGSLNTLWYKPNPGLRSGFTDAYQWPDFPDQISGPSFSYFSAVYGMYVSYNASCISKFS